MALLVCIAAENFRGPAWVLGPLKIKLVVVGSRMSPTRLSVSFEQLDRQGEEGISGLKSRHLTCHGDPSLSDMCQIQIQSRGGRQGGIAFQSNI